MEIKDKRRFNPDGTLREEYVRSKAEGSAPSDNKEPAADASSAAETADSKAEAGGSGEPAGQQEPIPAPDVFAVMQFAVQLLADHAWQSMGLVPPPGQKETKKDLAQARIAIDTVIFLADKIRPHVGEEQRRALQTLVSNLQINFVEQSR